MTKIRNGAITLLLAAAAVMYFGNIPKGWHGGGSDDDTGRTISVIALSSNDSLIIDVLLISSTKGKVLDEDNTRVGANSWHYDYDATANEHVRVTLNAWAHAESLNDKSFVRCRITDNGRTVNDDRVEFRNDRTSGTAYCEYTG